jgi:hypothetical protein
MVPVKFSRSGDGALLQWPRTPALSLWSATVTLVASSLAVFTASAGVASTLAVSTLFVWDLPWFISVLRFAGEPFARTGASPGQPGVA